jgi:hypothetical protein
MESVFLVESLGLNWLCFVKINDCPSLVVTIVSVPNDDWSSFLVFTSIDINTFLFFLEVTEVLISIGEELPPVGVGAPNLEFSGFSRACDVEGLVVQFGLDCQSSLVEPPNLSVHSVWSLDNHVSIVDYTEVSL